jgi:ribose transport system permease protein
MSMSTASPHASRLALGLGRSIRRYSAAWLWLAFMIIFSLTTETFLTTGSFRLVLTNQVTIGIVSLALMVPLAAGVFDLSVGAMLALGMVTSTYLSVNTGLNPLIGGLVAIGACGVMGFVNGFVVVKLGVNSFIATLGMSQVLSAIMLVISQNQQVVGDFPTWFQDLTKRTYLGISLDTYYLLLLAIVLWYVLEHTPIGRFLFATGGNSAAAKLAGLPVDRLMWGSLVASGVIAGFAGVLLASRVTVFSTSTGPAYLFPAFAAVFFGATQIKNRANVWGTLIAMFALAFGVQGLQLTFFGSQYWITPLFNGLALLLAVTLATFQGGSRGLTRRLSAGPPTDDETPPDVESERDDDPETRATASR